MLRECAICGKEDNERLMKCVNYGRRVEWWCWDCWKNSQREATLSDLYRQKRLYKMHESKKRKK